MPKEETELTSEMKREIEEMLIEELEFELRKLGFTTEQLDAIKNKPCEPSQEQRKH